MRTSQIWLAAALFSVLLVASPAVGSDSPSPDQRIYPLDGYWPGGAHATYGFYKGTPTYETVRAVVIDVLEGRRRAISGFAPTR